MSIKRKNVYNLEKDYTENRVKKSKFRLKVIEISIKSSNSVIIQNPKILGCRGEQTVTALSRIIKLPNGHSFFLFLFQPMRSGSGNLGLL